MEKKRTNSGPLRASTTKHSLYPSYPYIGTPANLAREVCWWLGPRRMDCSGFLRERYERARLSAAQIGAIQWLAVQPHGPAKILVTSEEWSSDYGRDVPMLARLAEAGE